MSTMDDFLLTDLVDDHHASHVMQLRAAALRAEYKNTETITGTKQLVDNDTPFQLITASGANRDVKLAAEATTNHVTAIYNNGGSNNVVVKDDSAATTFATLEPGEWCMAIPLGGSVWKVIDSNSLVNLMSTGAGAPASTPSAVGLFYVDTTNKVLYVSMGTSSSADWKAHQTSRTFGLKVLGTLSTGDGKDYSTPMPAMMNGMNVTAIIISVLTTSTSGTPTFQIARGRQASAGAAHTWVDVLSTRVTIDANEYSSLNAAAAYVIDTANDDIQTGDIFRADCDVTGTGTANAFVTITAGLP